MKKCYWCEGTGKFKKPLNEKKYEQEFDRLDNIGVLNSRTCRENALKESGFYEIECPNCNGKGSI